MAAGGVGARQHAGSCSWVLLVSLGCTFSAANVAAQPIVNLSASSDDVPPHYEGAIIHYTVEASGRDPGHALTRLEVRLEDYLDLIEVRNSGTGELVLGPFDGRCGGAVETGSATLDSGGTSFDVRAEQDAAAQLVTMEPPTYTPAFPTMLLVVRQCPSETCTDPAATLSWENPPGTLRPPVVGSASTICGNTITSVSFPDGLSAARGQGATAFGIDARAGGSAIRINTLLGAGDPVPPAAFACRASGVATFGDCSSGIVTLTVDSGAPLVIAAHANDLPDPQRGDAVVRVDFNELLGVPNGTHPLSELTIAVEQPVTQMTLEATDEQGAALAREGSDYVVSVGGLPATVSLRVAEALNLHGGNEPPVATWEIADVSYSDGASPAESPSLSTTTSDYAQPALLSIPPGAAPAPGEELSLSVSATHANPDGTSSTEPLSIRVSAPAVENRNTCRMVVEREQVGISSRVGIRVEVDYPDGSGEVVASPSFSTPTSGSVVELQTGEYTHAYLAPAESGSVTLRAEAQVCPSEVSRAIEVVRSVGRVRLRANPKTVFAGQTARLEGRVEVTRGVAPRLIVALDLDSPIKLLRHPRGKDGARITPLTKGSAPHIADGGGGRHLYALDLAGDATAVEFVLPVMARSISAGGRAAASIAVFYPAGADAGAQAISLGEASAELRVRGDPEFTETTLFGKVFHDKNGDGRQQEGELGLDAVMVGTSASMYAVTDSSGRYHMARLAPGRVAVKLNRATLPLGASIIGPETRVVSLTPGMFVRVNFPVRLAELDRKQLLTLRASESGPRFVDGALVYRAVLEGAEGELSASRASGSVVGNRLENGLVELLLPLDEEATHWLLVDSQRDGMTRTSAFGVFSYPRDGRGNLVVPWGPHPVANLLLPPAATPVGAQRLTILGHTRHGTKVALGAGGDPPECARGDGEKSGSQTYALRCDLHVRQPIEKMSLQVDPPPGPHGVDPPLQRVELSARANPSTHFFVGLAGAEAGWALHDVESSRDWSVDGGGAFFYRGALREGWLVTAGADAWARDVLLDPSGELRSMGGVGAELVGHDPTRVFRDLDPEEYFPTYGDGSLSFDERESGGRFFLRVQKDGSYLKWGGINTAIADAEVGRYVRSLYGLGTVLRLEDDSKWRLRAQAFAAQPDSAAARDDLVVTGGSLYFLSHQYLVQGSLRVTLEVLDEVTGLPIRVLSLVEGADYEADYNGGRIVLDPALPYRTLGQSLTADQGGGNRARLLAEYEFLPGKDLTSAWSLGGRVTGSAGPVTLGVTGVKELNFEQPNADELGLDYQLAAGTLRVDLGRPLRLRVEVANSRGESHVATRSFDGGLDVSESIDAAGKSGSALAAELSTSLEGAQASIYGRYYQPGFTDSRTASGRRLAQAGVQVRSRLASGTRLWGTYDRTDVKVRDQSRVIGSMTLEQPRQIRNLGLAGVAQRVGPIELAVEGRHATGELSDAHRTLAGAQLSYSLSPKLTLSVRRRQLIDADGATRDASASGESAAGLLASFDEDGRVAAEVGLDDDFELFGRVQGSMPVEEGVELYVGYQVASHLAWSTLPGQPQAPDGIVGGGRRTLDDGSLLYAEQSLQLDGSKRALARRVGGQLPLGERLGVAVSYERAALHPDDVLVGEVLRDATSISGTYAGERIALRLGADARLARRDRDRTAEIGAFGRMELKVNRALTWALAGRGASGMEGEKLGPSRRAWEGSVGFAYRPVHNDRFNVFGRYALEYDRSLDEVLDDWVGELSHVVAAAVVIEVLGPLSVTPKVAYRNTRFAEEGGGVTDQKLIAALRGDVHLEDRWDVGVEGRSCMAPGTRVEARTGALAELTLMALDWLRLGAGYNFSDISTSGVDCDQPGARGLYLRAEAVY